MAVTLRELTRDTWHECVDLAVADHQRDFVAPNLVSLAEAQFYPGTVCRAVYADEVMVGFVMYGPDAEYAPEEVGAYALIRLMIDQKYQGKGYGRAAIAAVINEVARLPDSRVLYTSYVPQNHQVADLYADMGFHSTGRILDDEVVVRLPLPPDRLLDVPLRLANDEGLR